MIVAGLGFRAACTADELIALIARVGEASGARIAALAVPDFKIGSDMLSEVSAYFKMEIRAVSRDSLIRVQLLCPSRSSAALAALGVASVAEACALAAAGPGARLLAPKTASVAATCALAASAWEGEGE
jgi:cobalt-precorrin 5A hydrolase